MLLKIFLFGQVRRTRNTISFLCYFFALRCKRSYTNLCWLKGQLMQLQTLRLGQGCKFFWSPSIRCFSLTGFFFRIGDSLCCSFFLFEKASLTRTEGCCNKNFSLYETWLQKYRRSQKFLIWCNLRVSELHDNRWMCAILFGFYGQPKFFCMC